MISPFPAIDLLHTFGDELAQRAMQLVPRNSVRQTGLKREYIKSEYLPSQQGRAEQWQQDDRVLKKFIRKSARILFGNSDFVNNLMQTSCTFKFSTTIELTRSSNGMKSIREPL